MMTLKQEGEVQEGKAREQRDGKTREKGRLKRCACYYYLSYAFLNIFFASATVCMGGVIYAVLGCSPGG